MAAIEMVLEAAKKFPGRKLQFVKTLAVGLNLHVDQFANWPDESEVLSDEQQAEKIKANMEHALLSKRLRQKIFRPAEVH